MADTFKFLRDLRYRIFYGALLRRAPLVKLGNESTGCAWNFCPDGLNKDSVVYGGGVGRDVTFEHALAQRFGCEVVLFDPSPTGLETMSLPENKIPQFHFVPVGLAGSNGTLRFAPPADPKEGSWYTDGSKAATIEVPCVDLSTLMKQNRHERIDLLKIDIEGAEYDVLEHLLSRKLRVKQVLVEFHHNILPAIPRSRSVRAILKMIAAGYKLLCQDGQNHTFHHPSL